MGKDGAGKPGRIQYLSHATNIMQGALPFHFTPTAAKTAGVGKTGNETNLPHLCKLPIKIATTGVRHHVGHVLTVHAVQ